MRLRPFFHPCGVVLVDEFVVGDELPEHGPEIEARGNTEIALR